MFDCVSPAAACRRVQLSSGVFCFFNFFVCDDDACGVCGAVAALVAVMWGREYPVYYPPTAAACDRRLLLSTGGECSIDVVIDCAEHSL